MDSVGLDLRIIADKATWDAELVPFAYQLLGNGQRCQDQPRPICVPANLIRPHEGHNRLAESGSGENGAASQAQSPASHFTLKGKRLLAKVGIGNLETDITGSDQFARQKIGVRAACRCTR